MSCYKATAAFFGTLVGHGLTDIVVSPGLRSVPLSLTAHATPGIRLSIQHDERVAGFLALGIAKVTRRPVVVICTSGSALANLLPAVVEAHHSRVPLILVTGDRPPDLHDWESPQTIRQQDLFGSFAQSVPMRLDVSPSDARSAAVAAWSTTQGRPAGPVHVNWPFDEPLEPVSTVDVTQETVQSVPREVLEPDQAAIDVLSSAAGNPRGVIAVGELGPGEAAAVLSVAERTGWPIVADPISGLRLAGRPRHVITTADHLLGDGPWADEHAPDAVLRIGSPLTSKALRLWMERTKPRHVVVADLAGRRRDPSRTMTDLLRLDATGVDRALSSAGRQTDSIWLEEWSAAETRAREVIAAVSAESFEEAAATMTTAAALTTGTCWHVASSTPIRDVDWYVAESSAVVSANRGAGGIDGTIATATGLALGSNSPTVVTIGDVALVHDVGGLIAAARSMRPPTVVVYDNGGGGIFSLLPIADVVDATAFRDVLHTPTDLDMPAVAKAARYKYLRIDDEGSLTAALIAAQSGDSAWFLHVPVTIEGSRAQLQAVRRGITGRS